MAPDDYLYRLRRGHNHLTEVERIMLGEAPDRGTISTKLDLARADYMHSIELRGDIAQAHIELGRSFLYGADRARQGIPVLKRAWSLAPDHAVVPVLLTMLGLRSGEEDLAGETLRRALSLYPFRLLDGLEAYGERQLRRYVVDGSTEVSEIRGAFELLARSRAGEDALPQGSRWRDLAGRIERLYRLAQLSDVATAIRDDPRPRAEALLAKLSGVDGNPRFSSLVEAFRTAIATDDSSVATGAPAVP